MYEEIKKHVQLDLSRKSEEDLSKFQQKLPFNMRMKLTMQVFKEITQKINFFKVKPEEFIAQVGPQLLKRTYN